MDDLIQNKKIHIREYPTTTVRSLLDMFIVLGLYGAASFFLVYAHLNFSWNSITFLAGALLLGFVLQWPYNACHDCIHQTFVKLRGLNEFFGVFLGTIVLLNFSLFKAYHRQHHANTFGRNEPEPIDQDIKSIGEYILNFSVPLFWVDNWVRSFYVIMKKPATNIYGKKLVMVSDRQRKRVIRDSCLLMVFLIGMIFLTAQYPVQIAILYWLPLYVSFAFDFFFLLPEHYGVDNVPGVNFVNARTTTSNKLVRFFLRNINYHTEHHRYPSIAQQYMHGVHKELIGDVKYVQASYIQFHRGVVRKLLRII